MKIKAITWGGLCLLGFATASCGNSWLDSGARSDTPSARLFAAQRAYDAQEYDKAAELLEKVVSDDPDNITARVKLSYAYNAQAGIGVYDIIKNSITAGKGSSGSGASGSFTSVAKIVGFSDDTTISGLRTCVNKQSGTDCSDMEKLRAQSTKLAKLYDSWKTLCPLLPVEVVSNLKKSYSKYSTTLGLDTCTGTTGSTPTAAYFAATMQALSQAMSLYQTVLDQDDDGTLDVVTKATSAQANLKTLQTEISGQSLSFSQMGSKLTELNAQVKSLISIADTIDSELFNVTLAQLYLVKDFVLRIPGLPSSVKENVNKSTAKLDEAREKISLLKAGVSTTSSGSAAPTTQVAVPDCTVEANASSPYCKVKKGGQSASTAIDSALQKQQTQIDTETDPAKKAEQQQKLEQQKTQVCTNFDQLKTVYGLPADTARPSNCTGVGLNLSGALPMSPMPELSVQATDGVVLESAVADGGLSLAHWGAATTSP